MKRCPECRRDYHDDTLSFCLVDGTALVSGVPSGLTDTESSTAILTSSAAGTEPLTRQFASGRSLRLPTHAPRKKLYIVGSVCALVLAALVGAGYLYYDSGASKQIGSIAVLPFVNESGNPDMEYLSDGMTETLISALSQIPNLDVRPRSSVFRYKGKDIDPQTIGKELGVQAVLNGRVAQHGQDISFYAELIDPGRNKTIWSRTYDSKQSDLINLQTQIARDVSGKLKTKLSGTDEAKVTKTYTTDPEAYQLYLKGNYYRTRYTEDGYKKGIEYYEKAIAIDPNYALAYNGIAKAYNTASEWYLPPNEAEPKAKEFALKAVELDDTLPDPHYTLINIAVWYDWKWTEIEREATRLKELDSTAPTVFSYYYAAMGRLNEAINAADAERRREPLDLQANVNLAVIYTYAGRYDEAIRQAQVALDMDPNFWSGLECVGLSLAGKKQIPDAIKTLEKARLVDNNPELLGYLGYVYGIAGRRSDAQKALTDLQQLSEQRFVSPYYFALVYTGLGDKEHALEWLNKGFEERCGNMILINLDPALESLRSEPGFKDLLKRMNLPDWR